MTKKPQSGVYLSVLQHIRLNLGFSWVLQDMSMMVASSSQHPTCPSTETVSSSSPRKVAWRRQTSKTSCNAPLLLHTQQGCCQTPATQTMLLSWTLLSVLTLVQPPRSAALACCANHSFCCRWSHGRCNYYSPHCHIGVPKVSSTCCLFTT